MAVSPSKEELIQYRLEAREALDDPILYQKGEDLKQAIEKLRQEKNSQKWKIYRPILLYKHLYPDIDFKVNHDLLDSLTEDLDIQIDDLTAELAIILQYKKDLRSSIELYSQQIEYQKQQQKKEEKKKITKEQKKSRKDQKCSESNSVHPLSGNPFFALLFHE